MCLNRCILEQVAVVVVVVVAVVVALVLDLNRSSDAFCYPGFFFLILHFEIRVNGACLLRSLFR